MTNRTKYTLSLLIAALGIGMFALVCTRREHPDVSSPFRDEARTSADSDAKRLADLNGRKMTDPAKTKGGPATPKDGGGMAGQPLASYGELKPMSPSVSPQAQSATTAALTKTHPERLTCAITPAPFDLAKWNADSAYRKAYLETPEPGRVYQSLAPGKDIPHIALASPSYVETLQGQPVVLSVKAPAGLPTTFSSFDAAHFTAGSGDGVVGSQLTTQTVVASDDGVATATLVAPPGVIENCRVRASCPAASGFVTFNVFVKLPTSSKPVAVTN